MENGDHRPKYCGNLLVRRSKRRSFINKVAFDGVFGVLSESEFKYYRSSTEWSNQERPQFSVQVLDIQAIEEVDDGAFSRRLCFQIVYTNHSKKDKPTRSIYLAAYEADELKSWITAIHKACIDNPVILLYCHPGRFTGKTWGCCSEPKTHSGCKPCTIQGLPVLISNKTKLKVSPAIEFFGFSVIANESFDSSLPGFLPFNQGDQLTVTEAAGKKEWKAFSTSSTSEYGLIPCQSVSIADITQEPWFFDDIPSGLTEALLREQDAGCFILRRNSTSGVNILSIRTENAVKHVQISFDDTSQKYRIIDGSESVSYANFLQFDSIQQLLDQCKQHPTLGVTLDKYPAIQTVDELWRIDWSDVTAGDEIESDLPWTIMEGKFKTQNALIQVQQPGCSDSVKEAFTNQARLLMTLSHENVIELYGRGSKGSRVFIVHSYYPGGVLTDYLARNASLLLSHPSELVNIITQILTVMVYLEESGVVHGELVTDNCIIGDKGAVKLCGFHFASSPWCTKPLQYNLDSNRVPILAPELDDGNRLTTKSDVWAFGLLVYTIITAGQRSITTVDQVLASLHCEDTLDQFESLAEIITSCLRMDPCCRPLFAQLQQRCGPRNRISSTPSASSHSLDLDDSFSSFNGVLANGLESSMNSETFSREHKDKRPSSEITDDVNGTNSSLSKSISFDIPRNKNVRFSDVDILEKLKAAELEALKAKALQRRAEADKDEIMSQVREAEKKCLKEVEMITRTFICRVNEANDRAASANEMRYVSEEAKRLAEEKFTLYKYESEKTIHDIQHMLEDTMLERDELAESLKTFGAQIEDSAISPKSERRGSLDDLEKKYQKFVNTSERTIHNMKAQLDDASHQNNLLTEELDATKMELRKTRELLEQAIKEKDDAAFRLDEANCEVEKLEETISRMVHKREKAERERDQLQILTDMSLMKLRHVERPKKRHSIGSVSTTPIEKRDPNLRRLSVQLMNLRTPSSRRRQSTDVIYEVVESSSPEEVTLFQTSDQKNKLVEHEVMEKGKSLSQSNELNSACQFVEEEVLQEEKTVHKNKLRSAECTIESTTHESPQTDGIEDASQAIEEEKLPGESTLFRQRGLDDTNQTGNETFTLTEVSDLFQEEGSQSVQRESSHEISLNVNELRCSTPMGSDSDAELIASVSNLSKSDEIMDMLRQECGNGRTHLQNENGNEKSIQLQNTSMNQAIGNDLKEQHFSDASLSNTKYDSYTFENDSEIDTENSYDNNNFNKDSALENNESSNKVNKTDDISTTNSRNKYHRNNRTAENYHHNNGVDNCYYDIKDSNSCYDDNENRSNVPTVVIDEFREDDNTKTTQSQKDDIQKIPKIAISLVDDDFTGNGYFSEDENTNERVFIVPFENGDTSMVFSFDSEGGANKGIPQTVL